MRWRMVWVVIRREYLQRVRSKWFVASTLGGPLLMAALIFLPAQLARRGEEAHQNLALVDRTGVLFQRLEGRLEEAGYRVRQEPWSDDILAELSRQVTDGDLGGYIVLDDATLRAGAAVLYGKSRPSTIRWATLRGAIAQAALESQLESRGVDVAALLGGGELRIELVTSEAASMEDPQGILAFVGAFLLYMVILLYAASVMRATLEEKTSRVVEIVISSMRPWQLMLGKILGVGSVGLTQLAVWVGSAAVLAFTVLPALIPLRVLPLFRDVCRGGRHVQLRGRGPAGPVSGHPVGHHPRGARRSGHSGAQFPPRRGHVVDPLLQPGPHVEPRGDGRRPGLAGRPFFSPDGPRHFGCGLGGGSDLPRGHLDGRKAPHPPRAVALG